MKTYYSDTDDQKTYLACWKITDSAQEFEPGRYRQDLRHGDRSSTVVVRHAQEKIPVDWFTHVLEFGNVMIAAQSSEYCWVTFADRKDGARFYNIWESYDASAVHMTCLTPLPKEFYEPPITIDISAEQLRSCPNHPIARKAILARQTLNPTSHHPAIHEEPQMNSQQIPGQGAGFEPPLLSRPYRQGFQTATFSGTAQTASLLYAWEDTASATSMNQARYAHGQKPAVAEREMGPTSDKK